MTQLRWHNGVLEYFEYREGGYIPPPWKPVPTVNDEKQDKPTINEEKKIGLCTKHIDVLNGLKIYLSIMEPGAEHCALDMAIREIEELIKEVGGPCDNEE